MPTARHATLDERLAHEEQASNEEDVVPVGITNQGLAKNLAVAQNQYGFVFHNHLGLERIVPATSAIAIWLDAPDTHSDYVNARNMKPQNIESGRWFIGGSMFRDWKTTPNSMLWLYGIPGSGKTVLSATIIDSIITHCQLNQGSAFAYFFFKFDDDLKRRYEYMVRSLVLQLALMRESIPKELEKLYSSCLDWKRAPSAAELVQVAASMVDDFDHVYLLIDAIDECTDLKELFEALELIHK